MKKHFQETPLYPLFLVLYVLLAQYTINISQIAPNEILRPAIVLTILAGILILLFYVSMGDWQKAAIPTLFAIILLLFYGHIQREIIIPLLGKSFYEYPWLGIIIWLTFVLFFAFLIPLWNNIKYLSIITNFLNITSLIVLLPQLVSIIIYYDRILTINQPLLPEINIQAQNISEPPPDIYYIILDGYGRQDILQEFFSYDNSKFVYELEERGFVIGHQSQANYMQTQLSLASTLNLSYLSTLENTLSTTNYREPLNLLIGQSQTHLFLESQGYQMIFILSESNFFKIKDDEIKFVPHQWSISLIENAILGNSVLQVLDPVAPASRWIRGYSSYEAYRGNLAYAFTIVREVVPMTSPKFVFVYFLTPHPPFVYDTNGNKKTQKHLFSLNDADTFPGSQSEYLQGYVGEISYINQHIIQVIDDIIANSEKPPIIILQADHGPGMLTSFKSLQHTCLKERFSILNAYYLPGTEEKPPVDISPVNSFRFIFNAYFDTNLPLLENQHFYSTWNTPYKFIEVTGLTKQSCTP